MFEVISLASQICAVVLVVALASRFHTGLLTFSPSWTRFLRTGDSDRPESDRGAVLIVLGLCLSMGTILTLNQFVGIHVFAVALGLLLAFSWRELTWPSWPVLASFALVAVISVLFIAFAFHLHGIWMREGVNHDLILYTRGGEWALGHGALAEDEIVGRVYHTGSGYGHCLFWIGDSCPLNRSGTHTFVGLMSLLRDRVIPVSTFLLTLPLALLTTASLWMNVPQTQGDRPGVRFALISLFGILVSVSAPILGALWNGNVATACGAMVLANAVLVFVSPAARNYKAETTIILGCLTGLAAHFYSESMWFVGLITAFHVGLCSLDGRSTSTGQRFLKLSVMAVGSWLLVGNAAILMALASLLTVSNEVGRDLPWQNYFLEVENWRWLSIPFSGHLYSWNDKYPSIVGATGTVLVCLLTLSSPNKLRMWISMSLVAMAVIAVELSDYYYGVHKIVQMFGAIVVVVGLAAIIQQTQSERKSATKIGSALAALSFAVVGIQIHSDLNFAERSREAANAFAAKAIRIGDVDNFERIGPNETIVLNDLSIPPADRFSKTNWIDFLVAREGAQVSMGNVANDPYRGAYVQFNMIDRMQREDRADWVIQGAETAGQVPIVVYENLQPYEAGSLRLYDLRNTHLPAVFQSTGWWDREAGHTWTSSAFTLNVLGETGYTGAPAGQIPVVDLELGFYAPPADGSVSVMRNGELLETLPATVTQIRLPVIDGYQVFEIGPSWEVQSPADIGQSGDTRKLFAAVSRITSRFAAPNQDTQKQ
tara:strand:+ start:29990 stop:32296 length:2307 start_codon:yes stop_codon:yes gene_type:complete